MSRLWPDEQRNNEAEMYCNMQADEISPDECDETRLAMTEIDQELYCKGCDMEDDMAKKKGICAECGAEKILAAKGLCWACYEKQKKRAAVSAESLAKEAEGAVEAEGEEAMESDAVLDDMARAAEFTREKLDELRDAPEISVVFSPAEMGLYDKLAADAAWNYRSVGNHIKYLLREACNGN